MVGQQVTSLDRLQRTPPPIDRWSLRLGESSGGVDTPDPMTLAPGIEDTDARYPGTAFDSRIMRDRGPYYQRAHYLPPASNWVNWTAAGPVRPELHVRQATLRELVGNSVSRFPVIDSPTTGMHTMSTHGVARSVRRFQATPQMRPVRQQRLAAGQYSGQTYSQTTRVQGSH